MSKYKDTRDWSWKPPYNTYSNRMLKKDFNFVRKQTIKELSLRGHEFSNCPSNLALAKSLAKVLGDTIPKKSLKSRVKKYIASNYKYLFEKRAPIQPKPKNTNKDFYQSWAWKKLRFSVLKKYGSFCMLCNSDKNIVVDHIKPRSKRPELELCFDNLQVLCNDCNMGKSNDDYTDFRPDGAGFAELEPEQQSHLTDILH